jgi:hypothetical protein
MLPECHTTSFTFLLVRTSLQNSSSQIGTNLRGIFGHIAPEICDTVAADIAPSVLAIVARLLPLDSKTIALENLNGVLSGTQIGQQQDAHELLVPLTNGIVE